MNTLSKEESSKNWFARHAESEAKKNVMPYYEARAISNDVARALMVLALIVLPIAIIYNSLLYVFVRREILKQSLKTT